MAFILQTSVENGEVCATTHFSTEDTALGELRRGILKVPSAKRVSMKAWRKLFPAAVTLQFSGTRMSAAVEAVDGAMRC